MIEKIVRIIMVTLTGAMFLLYTYISIKIYIYVRQAKKGIIIDDKEHLYILAKKSVATLCYALVMFAVGILYMTSISIYILTVVVIIIWFIVSFIDNKSFVLKSDLTEIKKNKSTK